MKPLIICRSSKTIYMADIGKALADNHGVKDLYAYVPYFDQWKEYLKDHKEVQFKEIFGTHEVFASINDQPTDPKEVERIEKLYGAELLWNLLLTERWLTSASTYPLFSQIRYYTKDQKLQCFVKLIQQAEEIFEQNDIDCIIDFANIGLFRIALDIVAKHKGIPYYHIDSALLQDLEEGDRYFVSRRINENYNFLDDDHKHYIKNPSQIKEGKEYLERFRSSKSGSIYSLWFGAKVGEKPPLGDVLAKKAKTFGTACAKLALCIPRDIKLHMAAKDDPAIKYNFALYKGDFISTLVRHYLSCVRSFYAQYLCRYVKEPPKEKYAFMTLHYQPEASTALMAPFENNQLAIIENVAKSLPLDVRLMVKMNKMMIKRDPISFIQRLNSYPNIHLVHHHANTRKLLEQCHCVVTITGTSAFEAALLGKKVIMLGDKTTPWHRLKSVVNVKDWRDVYKEIKSVSKFKADDDEIAAYLQAVHDNSFALKTNYAWEIEFDRNDANYKDSVETVTKAIMDLHTSSAEIIGYKNEARKAR